MVSCKLDTLDCFAWSFDNQNIQWDLSVLTPCWSSLPNIFYGRHDCNVWFQHQRCVQTRRCILSIGYHTSIFILPHHFLRSMIPSWPLEHILVFHQISCWSYSFPFQIFKVIIHFQNLRGLIKRLNDLCLVNFIRSLQLPLVVLYFSSQKYLFFL